LAGEAAQRWHPLGEPALLAVLGVSIDPVLRRRALHDEIEAVTVSIFAGPSFAFDVERLELASHAFPLAKSVLRTHGQKLRFAR
jgi:hypothetical protein